MAGVEIHAARPKTAPSVLSQILGARNPLNAARTTVAPWLRGTEERVPSVIPGLLAGAIEKAPIFAPTVGEAVGKTGEAVIGPELLAAMKMMEANPEQKADLIPAMASSPIAYPMVASMTVSDDIGRAVSDAELSGRLSDAVQPQDGHVYRFVTGPEYEDALTSGVLRPGRAADTGGTVNFSKAPIPIYGASATQSPGLLIEVPESAMPAGTRYYRGSTDLYAAAPDQIPMSAASRIFGVQFPGGGVKVADVMSLFRPRN